MTRSRLMLSPGTLYGLLRTLERKKLICRDRAVVRHRRRKVYSLTDRGRELQGPTRAAGA